MAIRQISRVGLSAYDVVLQYCWQQGVGQQFVYRHIQCLRQSGERIIGWREHREGTFCAQRVNQTGCTYGCLEQRVIFAVHDDVHDGVGRRCGRQQDRINYVNDSVVSGDVRTGNLGVVDEYAIGCDAHGDIFSQQRLDFLSVAQIGGVRLSTDNVVLENVPEVWQGQQLICSDIKRFSQRHYGSIGRGEHRERSFTAQRVNQTGCAYGCFEQCVIIAIHDDVHH